MSSDLVIVYHRQPYEEVEENGKTLLKENASPNGIVPTLKSFFGGVDHGAWVAWKLAEDPSNPDFERVIEISDIYGDYSVSRLPLTAEQVSDFYHITSKEAFWPILHNFRERYNYDPVNWPNFRQVNRAFAEAAAAEAAPGAVVWVHDYNLWLVPGYLRQMRPDLRISFFHHTPFPAADMFNVLPWRKEIVESLLACDVVGFHIARYSSNFVSVARSLLDVEEIVRVRVDDDFISEGTALTERTVPTQVEHNGRRVLISTAGVGVDVDYIVKQAEMPETKAHSDEIRAEMGDKRLILSVGRTDYTKGGVVQLESFGRVLAANPHLRGKVRLMHVSVSANRNMTAYAEVQDAIEQTAGRINGQYGTFDWTPITLISRPVPFSDLIAYYSAADVCWITPLADGMNLVCKEYVAARTDGDGVLVLSEYAGASVELGSAVITNPYSHRSMDRAIMAALDMPEDERRERMALLRGVVQKYDIRAWARAQQAAFEQARGNTDSVV